MKQSSKSPETRLEAANGASAVNVATRRERLESKEGAIISAAYKMFGTKGFAKSTISEIANAASVAEGTVYLYFKNKQALASAVIASFYERLTEQAQQGIERCETTHDRLEFLAAHHLKNIIEEKRILQLLSNLDRNADTYKGSEIYKMNKRYVAVFDGAVRDGIWRGDIEEGFSPWILRDIFYGALEYAMRTMEISDRKDEVERVTKELVMLITSSQQSSSSQKTTVTGAEMVKLVRRFENAADKIEQGLAGEENDRK